MSRQVLTKSLLRILIDGHSSQEQTHKLGDMFQTKARWEKKFKVKCSSEHYQETFKYFVVPFLFSFFVKSTIDPDDSVKRELLSIYSDLDLRVCDLYCLII